MACGLYQLTHSRDRMGGGGIVIEAMCQWVGIYLVQDGVLKSKKSHV